MIGLIFVSHSNFSEGLLNSVKMIFGDYENVESVALTNEGGIEAFAIELRKRISAFKELSGILVLADLQYGSPYNTSLNLFIEEFPEIEMQMVAGLNLPMVLEVLAMRKGTTLEELSEIAVKAGNMGIVKLENRISGESEEDEELYVEFC